MLRPAGLSAQALVARVIAQATAGNGAKPLPDDVAAMVVKRSE